MYIYMYIYIRIDMLCIIPVVCLHKIPVVYVHLTHETSGPEGSKSLANSTTRVNGAANHS